MLDAFTLGCSKLRIQITIIPMGSFGHTFSRVKCVGSKKNSVTGKCPALHYGAKLPSYRQAVQHPCADGEMECMNE